MAPPVSFASRVRLVLVLVLLGNGIKTEWNLEVRSNLSTCPGHGVMIKVMSCTKNAFKSRWNTLAFLLTIQPALRSQPHQPGSKPPVPSGFRKHLDTIPKVGMLRKRSCYFWRQQSRCSWAEPPQVPPVPAGIYPVAHRAGTGTGAQRWFQVSLRKYLKQGIWNEACFKNLGRHFGFLLQSWKPYWTK